ncbi:hypothetical protein ALC60_10235, partial [Trachymyrmex zeteki]
LAKEAAKHGRKLKFCIPFSDFFAIPQFHNKSWNRDVIVAINRSNHYHFNHSLHRKNILASPACQCGDARQDINH